MCSRLMEIWWNAATPQGTAESRIRPQNTAKMPQSPAIARGGILICRKTPPSHLECVFPTATLNCLFFALSLFMKIKFSESVITALIILSSESYSENHGNSIWANPVVISLFVSRLSWSQAEMQPHLSGVYSLRPVSIFSQSLIELFLTYCV